MTMHESCGVSLYHAVCVFQELLDNLHQAEAEEVRAHAQRRRAREAKLPKTGRGSAIHFRHSDVTDWCVPPAGVGPRGGGAGDTATAPSGGRWHPEARRHALVFQRLRDSVRKIQDDRGSAGPVRK